MASRTEKDKDEQWPYKWRLPDRCEFDDVSDLKIDWDNKKDRLALCDKLSGVGVLYVQQLEPEQPLQPLQPLQQLTDKSELPSLSLFRINYTFDLKDPILNEANIYIRRPMFRFRIVANTMWKVFKFDKTNSCRYREDLGVGHVECTDSIMLMICTECCNLAATIDPDKSTEDVRRIVNNQGLDYDTFYKCPTYEFVD